MFLSSRFAPRSLPSALFAGLLLWALPNTALPGNGLALEQETGRKLSLVEAVRTALSCNKEVLARRDAAKAQEKGIGVARSYLLPKVSLEESYSRTTNPGYAFMSRLNQERIEQQDFDPDFLNHPDPISDYRTSITIEQPLFVKKALLGLSMSRKEAAAAGEDLNRKQEETAYSVVKAFLMVQSAKEYARAVKTGIEEAQENARIAGLRYRNGLAQYADTLRTSTALTEARQRYNVAEKNLALAKEYLNLLVAAGEKIDVADTPIELPLAGLSYYTENAGGRSDVKAASLRGENAEQNVRLAEAGYLPSVGVGGAYQLDDHDTPFGSEGKSWQVSAFLRWELFDGMKREYERAKAIHLANQAKESLAALKQGVSYRITEAYLNAEEARKNAELARQALRTAEEGARLIRLRYENGLAPLADLLSAQAGLEQARAGIIQSENASRTASAALSYESGTILKDLHIQE